MATDRELASYSRLNARIHELESRLAAAEKDAERYRWLRDQTRRDVGFTLSDLGASIGVRNFPPDYLSLDMAIDQRRSVNSGEKA